jgi:hypothetical protein
MTKKRLTDESRDVLQKNQKQAENKAKAELIYWATGRSKIYPEKDFARNYADIKAESEKKRGKHSTSPRFRSNSNNL